MTTFIIPKPRGFSLQAALQFYTRFIPGSGMAAASTDGLSLAFRLDRSFEAVAVRINEAERELSLEASGSTDGAAVRAQVERILGLEGDAEAWAALGRANGLVGRLQHEFPGFFTATKSSPYDAAVWAVLAPRMRITDAARVKLAMSSEYGDRVRLGDTEHHVFPSPDALARIDEFPGVPAEKMARLRGVAHAAIEGQLDVTTLREMSEHVALRELQKLRGVGPWAASHIYYRGAAPLDGLPTAEPRVLHGLAHLLGSASISTDEFIRYADSWRPFRMWVCVLLSRHLAGTGGWRSPSLARERAAAGRAIARKPAGARLTADARR